MYDLNMNNKFYRVFAITVDKYGIDPLQDKMTGKIAAISTYTNHEVKQDERGAPDLISEREYNTEDFWWHIMTYNGICRFRDIVEGMTLKIPELGQIVNITNDTLTNAPIQGENIIVI